MNTQIVSWHKCTLDKTILKNLSTRSNWQGAKHIFVYFLILFLSGYMVVITWGGLWTIFWIIIYGNIYTFSNPIWHECGHNLAFKSRKLNEIFYHITSFMYNYEPTRWRWSHHHHHTYTLHTEKNYDHEIQVTKPTDLFYVLMIHLPGGNLFTFLFSHIETIKHAFGFNSIVLNDCVPMEEKNKVRYCARVHILLWIIIISFSIYFKNFFPILFLILPFLYGSTLINIIHFIQHAGLANNVKDHRLTTRTVKINYILNFLCWNMEYHLEHHMFPMVPSYNLKKLHEAVKDQMPKPKDSLWDAYKEIIPAILKQAKDPNYVLKVKLSE